MSNLTIAFERVGPERPTSTQVPPISMRLNGYVLDFDETLGSVAYVCGPGYDGFGEAWHWNGGAWTQHQSERLRLEGEGPHAGYYDVQRGGIVVHQFAYDYESETHRPRAMLVTEGAAKPIETSGAHPAPGDDVGTFDPRGAFAYDRTRDVGVCLTPKGVYELDPSGVWSRVIEPPAGVVPADWKDACGGLWDPVRRQVVFWVYTSDDYVHVFMGWNGRELTRLSTEGLHLRDFHIGLFHPSAGIVSHPEHGILMVDGAKPGTFAFRGDRWEKLRDADEPPPRMTDALVCHDPTRNLLVIGPGYHEGDAGGREAQRVFFVMSNGRWERQGVVAKDSPLAKINARRRYFTVGGETHVASLREAWTFAWRDDAWREIVDEKTGDALVGNDWLGNAIGAGEGAIGIMRKGVTLVYDGKGWTKERGKIPDFGERMDFTLTAEPNGRIVVWGGDVKNRKSNDTFVREEGAWRKVKKPSPRPKDFAHGSKDDVYVDYDAIWDSTLESVVRFGFEEVFTLRAGGDVWEAHTPSGYKKLAGSRRSEHIPVHDAETGETLLVNLVERRIVRFDLAKCELVGSLAFPGKLEPEKQHDSPAWARIEDDVWYDARTKTLHAQHREDLWGHYAWDLAPALQAAQKLGARKTLAGTAKATARAKGAKPASAPPVPGARLYVVDGRSRKLWYCDVDGKTVVRRWGPIGGKIQTKREKKKSDRAANEAAAKLVTGKRREGYVDASALKTESLLALAAVPSRALRVGKAQKGTLKDHTIDRLGGLPSGIGAKEWPKRRKKPLGFLFQIDASSLLAKHAGVAVFCTTDGTATEDESHNAAVLLKKLERAKKPLREAPEGVPVLAVHPLSLEPPRYEVLEERVQPLAAGDPEIGAAFDRLSSSPKVYDAVPYNKLGGEPVFLQGGEIGPKWRLVAQLDFDTLSLPGAWKDAGLAGCIYVLVSTDEKKAVAMWQYT